MDASERGLKRGPLSKNDPDYGALYRDRLQGDFYGAEYYRSPSSDIDSAIIYDDNEDKRVTAAFVALAFAPRRVLEVGCATGLLVKAMRGRGLDAEGFDFSRWCVENAHPAVRERVRWGDALDPASVGRGYDLVLALDILEHLPPDLVPRALANLAGGLDPGGRLFTVLPAYGPNAFGPEIYPLHLEEWRRDAALGIPFRNIPLDDKGRPHLGHLTHAAVPWWMAAFAKAGLTRLGSAERALHDRSFFLFAKAGFLAARTDGRRLVRRIAELPGLPRGFHEWERWGDVWMRWTEGEAWEALETCGRERLRLRAICNHPGIAEEPVEVAFEVGGASRAAVEFRDHDWHDVELSLPRRPFAGLRIVCKRTWSPDENVPPERRRRLGVGISIAP
jgi:SAM-dependent methyltransferase